VTALILAVAAVSVGALVWMGVRLVQQDRALEAQQFAQRREAAADRLVAALEQVLTAEERRLASTATVGLPGTTDGAVLVLAEAAEIHVSPEGAIPYVPVMPAGLEAPAGLYAAAERAEFVDRDYRRAITALQPLSRAHDPAERAGALLRLARNLRKAGRREAALAAYDELERLRGTGVTLGGVPADLVARGARCALLEEMGESEQLRQEAMRLHDDLQKVRWRLDRDSYAYHLTRAARWLDGGSAPVIIGDPVADAVDWVWQVWQRSRGGEGAAAGRRALRPGGVPITVVWQGSDERLAALVADPAYQKRAWFERALAGQDLPGVRVRVADSGDATVDGDPPPGEGLRAARFAAVTGLPWDVVVVNADLQADLDQFAQRRRLIPAGLAMLAVLVIAAGTLISRAVSRELAAARLQSDFVAAVSHEFRTPLTSMRQFTEMLVEDDDLAPEKRRSYYRAQQRATQRLSRLVESLLDFGRMEAGARPYRLEPLDAGRLARSVVEEFCQEVACDGFAVECAVPERPAIVNADREALAQALWNLLDNAVKYSPPGGAVRVEVEAGDGVAIRVRDRGYGIPPAEREQILRKFARGSSATALGVNGTGIGLAMVTHIVDAHGGRLRIDSEPGQGSTFTIELPRGG
jgi:signal transduction histidine kinase